MRAAIWSLIELPSSILFGTAAVLCGYDGQWTAAGLFTVAAFAALF